MFYVLFLLGLGILLSLTSIICQIFNVNLKFSYLMFWVGFGFVMVSGIMGLIVGH